MPTSAPRRSSRSDRRACGSSSGPRRGRRTVRIPGLGRHAVHNALAAAAVGGAAGLDLDAIATGLTAGSDATHRGELIRLGEVTILDDSYNAAPATMLAALDVLASLPGRRVAVLGEMLELGRRATQGHVEVGRAAARVADLLVVVGEDAGGIADGAREAGLDADRIFEVDDAETAHDVLRPRPRAGRRRPRQGLPRDRLDRLVATLRRELEP